MFAEDESDSEYARNGFSHGTSWPYIRLLQREESDARDKAGRMIREMHRRDTISKNPGEKEVYVPDKQILREYYPKIDFTGHNDYDWRRWRFFRFCLELQGFHKGQLDFSARTPERYNKLIGTWSKFSPDFEGCLSASLSDRADNSEPTSATEMLQDNGTKLWRNFYSKWGISRTVSIVEIIEHYVRTRNVLRTFREPVFQRLYLVDLPPEVLGMIFSHTSEMLDDGRLLSTTCHYLRNIGQAYIFRRRTVLMEFPINFPTNEASSPDHERFLREVADSLSRSLTPFLADLDFLLSRQYICSRISYLQLGSYWPLSIVDVAKDVCAAQLSTMNERITSLLAESARVRDLRIYNLQFDIALAQQFLELPALSICGLSGWRPDAALEEHILSLPPGTLRSRVRGLRISSRQGDPECSFWLFLALCPSLQLLHVFSYFSDAVYRAPESHLWMHLAPTLQNVERLLLEGIDLTLDLHDCFLATTMLGPIRLTHFKLQSERHMLCHTVVDLVHTLYSCNAPLEVLVLDGVMPASRELFDTLSQLFPDLRGLSVHRYTGKRVKHSCERRRVPWELPLHEYAAYFRRFTSLRHFGANFYWDEDAVSPQAMDILLSGNDYIKSEGEDEDDLLMTSFRDIALPFAAYCPSLTSFRVDGTIPPRLHIYRSSSGAIIMQYPQNSWFKGSETDGKSAEAWPEDSEIWEPSSTFNTWGLPNAERAEW